MENKSKFYNWLERQLIGMKREDIVFLAMAIVLGFLGIGLLITAFIVA